MKLFSDEHRITYSVQSLWWFCKNLPLCKSAPSNLDKIRDTCPFIIREKVCDFNDRKSNIENVMGISNINNNNHRVTNFNTIRAGSGRILKKPFKSLSSSMSFDESAIQNGKPWRADSNNNSGFRRSTSTMCLKDSNTNILDIKQVPREA